MVVEPGVSCGIAPQRLTAKPRQIAPECFDEELFIRMNA